MDSNRTQKPFANPKNDLTVPPPLLDIDAAAAYLKVGPRFIRRLIAQRRINYLKIGKFIRFERTELDDWVQEQRVDAILNTTRSR